MKDEVAATFDTGIEKLGKSSLSRSCLGRFTRPYFKDGDGYVNYAFFNKPILQIDF